MLDLEPRVHLEEGRLRRVVDEELAGPGTDVADRAGERQRGLAEPLAERGVDRRRRRLLEDLLVAALDRAVAFAEVDAVAVAHRTGPGSRRGGAPSTRRSRMSRSSPNAAVASRRAAASASGRRLGLADRAHALAAAAGRGLDEQAGSRSGRRGVERVVRLVGVVVAGRGPGRRARPPAGAPRPCRPSRGSRPAAGRPSGSRRRATASAKSAFSARNPNPGGPRRRPPRERPRRPRATSSRSSAPGPSVAGTTARIPSRSQVRADAGRDLAPVGDEERPDRRSAATSPASGRWPAHERVNRVSRDTPTATNASRRQPTARDPALDGPRRRPDARGGLARTQFLGHRVAIVAYRATGRRPRGGRHRGDQVLWSGAQAGRRFSVNARKPSCASSLVRCRAMTRAVCHLAEPWPSPRTSRTIAFAARAAVGPAASRSATAASTAASSASSPSTISWTSPIRAARVASNRRPPGNSARAWLSPILAIDERADHRRQDPEPRLGEPEPRARTRR